MIQQIGRGHMTASDAVVIFKHGLNDELGVTTAWHYDIKPDEDGRSSRIFSPMYNVAARLTADASEILERLFEEYTPDFSRKFRTRSNSSLTTSWAIRGKVRDRGNTQRPGS
ncbi:hypothetical protein Sbs19_08780 [Sphingobium sp. BS19]|nr:hypothetical protein Sbs19_08780 [Sphingobium sp. BS19]